MPRRIESNRRPWEPEKVNYNAMQGQGRLIINPFYHLAVWKKFRIEHLMMEPLCRECRALGVTREGKVIDHIKPINPSNAFETDGGRYGEPLDHANCQTLCIHHNAVKTGKDRKRK